MKNQDNRGQTLCVWLLLKGVHVVPIDPITVVKRFVFLLPYTPSNIEIDSPAFSRDPLS